MTDEAPETRYARSGDVNIAYQVVGEGESDIVAIPPFLSHVELEWTIPKAAAYHRRLSEMGLIPGEWRIFAVDAVPVAA